MRARSVTLRRSPLCPGGGIGRRAGFRCQWPLWSWKFESSPGHHLRWSILYNQLKYSYTVSLCEALMLSTCTNVSQFVSIGVWVDHFNTYLYQRGGFYYFSRRIPRELHHCHAKHRMVFALNISRSIKQCVLLGPCLMGCNDTRKAKGWNFYIEKI